MYKEIILISVFAITILCLKERDDQQMPHGMNGRNSFKHNFSDAKDVYEGDRGQGMAEDEKFKRNFSLPPTTSEFNFDSHLLVPDIAGKLLFVIGVPINLLSFFYFMSRREKGPNELMFLCLSTTDTVICIYLVGAFPVVRESMVYQKIYRVYDQICYISTFVTCQMSVVRMIALTHPLLRMHKRVIVITLLLFIILQFLPFFVDLTYFYLDEQSYPMVWNLYYFIISTLIIIIAIVSSVITVTTLRRSGKNSVTKNKRKATITIMILTVTFLVYNIPHDLMLITYLIGQWREGSILYGNADHFIDKVNLFYTQIGMQLNSITNAIIYFIRISNMRQFVACGITAALHCYRSDTHHHQYTDTET